MTNICCICGKLKPMEETTICSDCEQALKRNGYIKVVTCNDCKFFDNYNVECNENHKPNPPYTKWFCSDGIRKE